MKLSLVTVLILLITQTVLCQEANSIRVRNDLGFQIKKVNSRYIILDSLGNQVLRDTFDYVTLESINSWGMKRNSFVSKKNSKSCLISSDCQKILQFDSISILEGGDYICISDKGYSLINDDFEILHENLVFLKPLIRMPGEFIFKKSTSSGILDEEEILIEMNVDSLIDIYSWKYIGIVSNQKMGIFDYDREKVLLKPKYDYIAESHIHSENEKQRFLIFNDGKFNLVNKKGKDLTHYDFDCITTWVEYGPEGHYI